MPFHYGTLNLQTFFWDLTFINLPLKWPWPANKNWYIRMSRRPEWWFPCNWHSVMISKTSSIIKLNLLLSNLELFMLNNIQVFCNSNTEWWRLFYKSLHLYALNLDKRLSPAVITIKCWCHAAMHFSCQNRYTYPETALQGIPYQITLHIYLYNVYPPFQNYL